MKNIIQKISPHPYHRMFKVSLICSLLLILSFFTQAQVSWLHIEGNQIKDAKGNDVTLRGVSVLAPEHNNECEYCEAKPISEMITWQADAARGWNSRIVRLQITTAKIRDPEISFKTVIDPYVQQAIAMGLYVIVDLHHVSDFAYNGSDGISQQSVLDFWSYVAPKYANTPNVLFEVFNEPIGPDCWSCWKEYIQPVVDAIRRVAPHNLILMGGPQWSTRVNQAVNDPFSDANMAYVYHIYPNQGPATDANLDAKFGTAALSIPVILTEFGWNQAGDYSNSVTQGTTSGWGQPFREYLDARPNISWTSYIFDNFWKPQYFDWNWNLMGGENQGQFMRQWFLEMKDANQPQPANLIAHGVTSGQINLAWPATENALGYNIKRSSTTGGPYTTIATGIAGIRFSDTILAPQTQYYYVISALTPGGEGPNSAEVSATTVSPAYTPDPPLFLTARGENGKVTLSWARAVGAFEYHIKRSQTSGGPYSIIETVSDTTTFADTEVNNGKTYYYVVSALNGEKESANSRETGDMPSSEILIIDNASAEPTGSWTASTGSPGFYGINYLHDGNSGTTGGRKVTYSPAFTSAGSYQVSLWWTAASNRASNVPVEVHHAGGVTTFHLNQQFNGKLWVHLGIFRFNEGSTGKVFVKNDDADGYVIADAVKFSRATQSSNLYPTASFKHIVQGTQVAFNASDSWDPDGSITNYLWDFGDSTTATGKEVNHVYAASGEYEVTLTVRDDSSATNVLRRTVNVIQAVNDRPTAAFTYTSHVLDVTFDASSSSDNDGNITGYLWDFGDNTTAQGAVVTHRYPAKGDYTVTLTVSDDSSAQDTSQQVITLSDDITDTTTVTINQRQNGSTMNVIGTYSFGAGTSAAVRIRTDGTNGYVVADAVKFSMAGQSDIIVDNEDITAVVQGNWVSNNYTGGYVGSDYLHDENTGKGTKSITYTPNLPVQGNWTVFMQWTSHRNRATNVPLDIIHLMDTTDNSPPTAAFSYVPGGLTVNFDASQSTDDGEIIDYTWHFGDGATASGPLESHTYQTEGNYIVTLTVTDDNDITHTIQQSVFVVDGDGASTFRLNQRQNGGVMNVIGSFPFQAGRKGYVKIRTDNTDGYVVADAVKFSMEGQGDIILDNLDSTAVTINGEWPLSAVNTGFFGSNYIHDDNSGKGTKYISFTPDLPAAGNWTVSIQWTAYANRATNVPVDVFYASTDTTSKEIMFISEILKSSIDSGRWGLHPHGAVKISLKDKNGNPVPGAEVSGTFEGDYQENLSGITGPDGTVTLVTTAPKSFEPWWNREKPKSLKDLFGYLRELFENLQKHEPAFSFCVENVTHDKYLYTHNENSITCTESLAKGQTPAVKNATKIAGQPLPAQHNRLLVYPNPLTGENLKIFYEAAPDEDTFIKVVSLSGRVILQMKLTEPEISVNRSKFSPGSYLIHITSKDKTSTTRLVVN